MDSEIASARSLVLAHTKPTPHRCTLSSPTTNATPLIHHREEKMKTTTRVSSTALSAQVGSSTRSRTGDLARLQEPRACGCMFCACISSDGQGRVPSPSSHSGDRWVSEDAHHIDPWRALVCLPCTTPAFPRATAVSASPSLCTVLPSTCSFCRSIVFFIVAPLISSSVRMPIPDPVPLPAQGMLAYPDAPTQSIRSS
ncbi:hypothetical protein B0H13DRAFT_2664177 [Mycena leptocephala]|nr:hypothetical protein B0H13DRAFT_2664177 [Mycena leptocephala]